MKKLCIEFLGTFFFILTIILTHNAFAIAAMLMAWVYIGGYISGANYNPMLSLAVAMRGRLPWHELPYYMIAQIVGGTAAFFMASCLGAPHLIPAPGTNLLQAGIVEILLSFVFAAVVLTVTTAKEFKTSHIFGFAIGFTIPALAAVGGPISGGLFNPAIALGATLFGIVKGIPPVWGDVFMYVVGAFVGGFIAAFLFNYCEEEQ